MERNDTTYSTILTTRTHSKDSNIHNKKSIKDTTAHIKAILLRTKNYARRASPIFYTNNSDNIFG